ncbi:DUF4625 domain-containing protein [Tamlana sp. 2_MG-2023]|uniref:DUF4625 domain-containing protein n=1 Tax=unclassified Tamlana TaxID=2614803 RepID=UPI0026E33A8F|nr:MULTISPECIES: DUF4625 domain-containing protein [unclassified Tamlana]MDO6759513.1 DUF4625 domain-containing protein [Tamlana sp. 2_MG-2023]MDO6790348.1 DUF4625 domain-containing protein [Tamlana sp. 1_MG-2023]
MKRNLKPNHFLFVILITVIFFSCSSDDVEIVSIKPIISNVEVGLNDNEIGVVGRDFHLNAKIIAGDKIDLAQIKIEPIEGESYASPWNFELNWDEYKGVKNATIHKHFDIPEDAVEGYYSFTIIVNDENGTTLEEKRNITIYKAENLPVDPKLTEFTVAARSDSYRVLYIHTLGGYRDPETQEYGNYNVYIDNAETLDVAVNLSGIKDDGQIYILLINKKHNHRPESISSIDFTKSIVVDVFEHTNLEQTDRWSNINFERPNFPNLSKLLIGASVDNNLPNPNKISDVKGWESGDYYVGFIYKNTTHNISLFHYIEVALSI